MLLVKLVQEVAPLAFAAWQSGYFTISPKAIKDYVDAKADEYLKDK